LQQARKAKRVILQAAVAQENEPEAALKLSILDIAIAEGDFEQQVEVPIELTDSEKTQHNNEWRTYREEMPSSLNIGARHSHSFLDSAPNCCKTR
jgi:hypothetical protein